MLVVVVLLFSLCTAKEAMEAASRKKKQCDIVVTMIFNLILLPYASEYYSNWKHTADVTV